MGDLNVQPDNPALIEIDKRLKSAAAEMNNNEFTFASYNPKVHIDYIYVPKTSKVISYEVHKLRASDHMPISAEIEL
jgi:endonuclease/exonuclease/phosphatase family metal-dependent hydrolase